MEQDLALQDSENRTETGQSSAKRKGKLAKTHQDYWFARLRKRSYSGPDGKSQIEIPSWQVRLFHGNREGWFNLDTANQTAAAVKARDIYVCLRANGWDATLAKFKPDSNAPPRLNLSVGDYLSAVKDTGLLKIRTFLNYQNCFRSIVSEAFGVKSDKTKFDYRTGGNQKWVERIDSIRLERVTPDKVMEWQRARLKAAGNSPTAMSAAKRTANSYVRCARSLFSKDVLKRLKGVQLPDPLPFHGVELFESGSMKYVSKVDVQSLIVSARKELKQSDPETYKVFLLGLFAGMRRAEIDLAEWAMLDWENGLLKLEETNWLHLKTIDSAGEIAIDPEVMTELKKFGPSAKRRSRAAKAKSIFIIASDRPPRNNSARPYYRCAPVFDRLNEWLRSKGVKANKPLHEMRKEIGALIATEHGIYAASRFLRHSDITTTARHYAQHKTRISVGLGKLLQH